METIKKNLFKQYKPYEPVVLTTTQKDEVLIILGSIADQLINILGPDEFLKEISNIRATVQWVVGETAKYLPEDIERVDGECLEPLVKQIIAIKKAEILEA